ncbi:MAG: hypothetical protein Q9181_006826 [Wetmoreana brouardii]
MTALAKLPGRSLAAVLDRFMGLTDEVVTVLVGPKATPFYLHKALLSSKSEYCRAAFEGSFKEATVKRIHLTDEDPKYFSYYVLWMYDKALEPADSDEVEGLDIDEYCHLFVLAEKLESETLQNLVMDNICEHIKMSNDQYLAAKTVNFVWDRTLPGSVLRKLLVNIVAFEISVTDDTGLADANRDFLYELVKVYTCRLPLRIDYETAPYEKTLDKCINFHIHRSSGTCPFV